MIRARRTCSIWNRVAGARIIGGALMLAACGAGERAAAPVVVRDSAGIAVVENRGGGAWGQGEAWRLSAEPVVDIGVLDGPAAYRLYAVRGAVRLSDGRIVVANAGTHELRFYSANGEHLRTVGGEGGGPGEFRDIGTLDAFAGDSLLVYDRRQRRVSIFDASGAFIRSFTPGAETEFPTVRAVLSDGSLLASLAASFGPGGPRTGIYRPAPAYVRYDGNGAFVDTVGVFPSAPVYIKAFDGGFGFLSVPFAPSSEVVAGGGHVYYGPGDAYELRVHSLEGELIRLIRRDQPERPVTAADIERYTEAELEEAASDDARRRLAQSLRDLPFPETMAAYGALAVDGLGDVWVEVFRAPGDEQPRRDVFDPDGRFLGTVEMPPRFTVHEIGEDYVLGSWQDEFDVEHVRMYALVKPTTTS
ncbi:MAG TPA: hypothetical protein VF188_15620 [Longimicrobiales bacterium]